MAAGHRVTIACPSGPRATIVAFDRNATHMPWFRRDTLARSVPVAMTGVRMGENVLHIGCADPDLLTTIASKVGLSGRACAVVYGGTEATRARDAAAAAGVLIEIEEAGSGFNDPADSFDLVVIDNTGGLLTGMRPEQRVQCLQETFRVLRSGGRCVVVEAVPRGGILGILERHIADKPGLDPAASGGTTTALKAEGFLGVRVLGEQEGRRFVEATKRVPGVRA
jgi:ubiquinone/menaquinone biosynthesis C-methylase UbiE